MSRGANICKCGGKALTQSSHPERSDRGVTIRYRRCRKCGNKITTEEKQREILPDSANK